MTSSIGIIGVGEIASACVDGLCARPDHPRFFLSPRTAERAARLAEAHDRVEVCASNQEVVESSEMIVLSVLPGQVGSVLADLDIPGDRTVVSAVAGVSTEALTPLLPHDPTLVRVIPLPAVRERRGVTAVFPAHPATEEIFDSLGGTVVAADEAQFSTLSAATATMSAHFAFLTGIADWLEAQGWSRADAEHFVRGEFGGLATALEDPNTSLSDLIPAHETPGGLNEMLRAEWMDEDNRARLARALDHVHERVTGSSTSG
ncbi:pyrroline-5-carboxylate reductase [Brevibacterium sanguinis]|uniref:Pyrroline-5-carboxylate reductase n=2 Tax=Brevibacterium TaxID=1696 RepID=A0A366IMN2_9MICO|nr:MULTISPECIES: NAD(P)-binding domain-containing protein [Brevibacterium]RBP61681.1 pyrroline-5-carboxylate reductase [Brevibacterium sanguinis]RBP74338.1 pyrroline-5-carboxylate reductase [Brevibacterium celere]